MSTGVLPACISVGLKWGVPRPPHHRPLRKEGHGKFDDYPLHTGAGWVSGYGKPQDPAPGLGEHSLRSLGTAGVG